MFIIVSDIEYLNLKFEIKICDILIPKNKVIINFLVDSFLVNRQI